MAWRSIPLAAILCFPLAAQAADGLDPLPYRFLLVISDQWKDPASYLIEGGGEFQTLVSLLKTWGLPIDILRLDQQRLDRYYLLDREGRPRYGTIIWDAGPTGMEGKDLQTTCPEKQTITVPKGLGRHVVRVGPATQ